MLHGCTQDPTDFATGTKMNTYCEQYDCFVLYPEQPSSANIENCWNWFETDCQTRGGGEAGLIVQMATSLFAKYPIDKTRVFVGGLSSGGAMSAILAATNPDFFAAAAVASGLEFQAATSDIAAFTAMIMGGPDPTTQGRLAYKAAQGNNRKITLLVTHGSADITVWPVNGQQVVAQAAKNFDLTLGNGQSKGYITSKPTNTSSGQVPGGHSYTTNTYADTLDGDVLITYIVVDGMVHAWSGGDSAGTYTDPQGPDASKIMIELFYSWTDYTPQK